MSLTPPAPTAASRPTARSGLAANACAIEYWPRIKQIIPLKRTIAKIEIRQPRPQCRVSNRRLGASKEKSK